MQRVTDNFIDYKWKYHRCSIKEIAEDMTGKTYHYHVSFWIPQFLYCDPYTVMTSPDSALSDSWSKWDLAAGFKFGAKEAIWRLTTKSGGDLRDAHSGFDRRKTSAWIVSCAGPLGFVSRHYQSIRAKTGFDYISDLGKHVVQLQSSLTVTDYDEDGRVNSQSAMIRRTVMLQRRFFLQQPADPAQANCDLKTMWFRPTMMRESQTLMLSGHHIYLTYDSAFHITGTGLHYRMNPNGFQNGTGVGVRRPASTKCFASLRLTSLYCGEEFNVDGFRFRPDGNYDVKRWMPSVVSLMRWIRRLLLYGEAGIWGIGLEARRQGQRTMLISCRDWTFSMIRSEMQLWPMALRRHRWSVVRRRRISSLSLSWQQWAKSQSWSALTTWGTWYFNLHDFCWWAASSKTMFLPPSDWVGTVRTWKPWHGFHGAGDREFSPASYGRGRPSPA